MKRLFALAAHLLLATALVSGCSSNESYEPPPEQIPEIPAGRGGGGGAGGLAAPTK